MAADKGDASPNATTVMPQGAQVIERGTITKAVLFMADFSGGGAEKVMVNIANELSARNTRTDLLVARALGPYLQTVNPGVRIVPLARRLSRALLPLVQYLREERPASLLAAGEDACFVAVVARALSRTPVRLVLSLHCAISRPSRPTRTTIREFFVRHATKLLFRRADCVVCVSEQLRREALRVIGGDCAKFQTIYNPLFFPSLLQSADEPIDSNRFLPDKAGHPPLIAVGRLTPQKGFDVLLRALARVRQQSDMRLVILGEGPDLQFLTNLAHDLQIGDSVTFAGFVSNPYPYLKRARMLIMPSRWEGFGNVLVEAMAVGTPVVAADCPYGPREILANGEYGLLVPPDDPEHLARAILQTAESARRSEHLRARAAQFSIRAAVDRYEKVLGLR